MVTEIDNLVKLVQAAKSGNTDALTELYHSTNNYVYFLVLKSVGNEHDAADIVQEIYIKAFAQLSTLRDDSTFMGWLKRITQNCICDFARRKQPVADGQEHEQEELSEEFLPQEYVDSEAKRQLVMDIIDRLPDVQRTVIMLFYFEDMPIAQIADHMECSESTIKSRLNYAKRTIKRDVEALEKKGTKLYAIPAIPILSQILRAMSQDYTMPEAVSERILNATLETVATGAVAGSAVAGASAVAEGSAATTAAEAGTGIGAKIAAAPLAAKIGGAIAAVGIGVAAIIGGIVGADNSQLGGDTARRVMFPADETGYVSTGIVYHRGAEDGKATMINGINIITLMDWPDINPEDIEDIVVTIDGEAFSAQAVSTHNTTSESTYDDDYHERRDVKSVWVQFDEPFTQTGTYEITYTLFDVRRMASPLIWQKTDDGAPLEPDWDDIEPVWSGGAPRDIARQREYQSIHGYRVEYYRIAEHFTDSR